jgi:hypothetical protein
VIFGKLVYNSGKEETVDGPWLVTNSTCAAPLAALTPHILAAALAWAITGMNSASPRRWLQYLVWLPVGPDASPDDQLNSILALRRIEKWLRDHHTPRPLFDKYGRPKSPLVSVSFEDKDLETALAYRGFCTAIGLSQSMQQNYIIDNLAERNDRWI